MKKTLRLWLPVIIWASFIFVLSSFSSLPSPDKIWWDFVFKKSAHMFVYAVLYFLTLRAVGRKTPANFAMAFAVCIAYAISDEFHQSFTPGRSPKPTDVGFDTIGMGLTYLRLNHLI